jgi:hypothetical protein
MSSTDFSPFFLFSPQMIPDEMMAAVVFCWALAITEWGLDYCDTLSFLINSINAIQTSPMKDSFHHRS